MADYQKMYYILCAAGRSHAPGRNETPRTDLPKFYKMGKIQKISKISIDFFVRNI